MSPALQERFAEINLSINYFHWRHLGNMYYKWGNDGPKLSARIVKVLSYPRNLWTSSSSHPAGPLIIEMNVFHLNQYSWVLLEPHHLVDFFFFFYISDVFLFLFFSVFICLFFSSVLNSWLKVCVFFLSSFYQQDWKRSVFIPIPKKGNAKECSNYCTIALISHASKVVLEITYIACCYTF